MLQYNADDPTISPRFRPVYARKAQGAAVAPLTLPDALGDHCRFSEDQVRDAFRVLTDWARTGSNLITMRRVSQSVTS